MIDIPIAEIQEKLKTKTIDGQVHIFDIIRKKYIVLMPEELVRQMLLIYLTDCAKYPASKIVVERGTAYKEKQGRYDIIIYDKKVKPWMLIECKSHKVRLSQRTVDQLSAYNKSLNAPYYMISNGINTYCYNSDANKQRYEIIEQLPVYDAPSNT